MAGPDTTRLLQLACRGAAELPNDPFRSFADIPLRDHRTNRLKAMQRRQAMAQAAAFYDWLIKEYGG